jgi:sterol desaturase/sphingolipid hydroxylase (fatty acid hydroxylase superfamily)
LLIWLGYKFLADYLPFYGGIAFHSTHHAGFSCNYASRFTWLDKLFGTYSDPRDDTNIKKQDISKKTK